MEARMRKFFIINILIVFLSVNNCYADQWGFGISGGYAGNDSVVSGIFNYGSGYVAPAAVVPAAPVCGVCDPYVQCCVQRWASVPYTDIYGRPSTRQISVWEPCPYYSPYNSSYVAPVAPVYGGYAPYSGTYYTYAPGVGWNAHVSYFQPYCNGGRCCNNNCDDDYHNGHHEKNAYSKPRSIDKRSYSDNPNPDKRKLSENRYIRYGDSTYIKPIVSKSSAYVRTPYRPAINNSDRHRLDTISRPNSNFTSKPNKPLSN
jgi:hypothetical protein